MAVASKAAPAFMREVMAAVRTACGADFIVGIKLPADERVPGGIDPDEAERIARAAAAERRARLSLLQPGRVRARVRYPSARHALPASAVPAASHAAPRGRRRAPGDRPRQDRIGGGGRGSARRGRLRHSRLQPPADLGRQLAPQDSGRPGRRRARLHVLQLLLGRDSRRQTHSLLPRTPCWGARGRPAGSLRPPMPASAWR